MKSSILCACILLAGIVCYASGEVYFKETFDGRKENHAFTPAHLSFNLIIILQLHVQQTYQLCARSHANIVPPAPI
jgi:hypothetical protein